MLRLRIPSPTEAHKITNFLKDHMVLFHFKNKVAIDWDKIETITRKVLEGSTNERCLFIVEEDFNIKGVIGGQVFLPLWNEDKIACELVFCIDRKSKKSAVILAKAFENWARHVGCSFVQIGLDKEERTTYLNGFVSTEQMYMKDIR